MRSITRYGIWTATLAIVLMCGCAGPGVSVKSNVSASHSSEGNRIFVVLDTRELDEMTQDVRFEQAEFGLGEPDTISFGRQFLQELALRFDSVGVEYDFYRNTRVELNEEECVRLAKRFSADEVVWVKEDFIGITRNSKTFTLVPFEEVSELTLAASIRNDIKDNEFDWRASIEVEKGIGDWSQMAQAGASTLVSRLVADGIVGK